MTGSSPLAGLLDRAGRVFSLAGDLGRAFSEDEGQTRQASRAGWKHHSTAIREFCDSLTDLSDAMQNPPDGFEPVATPLLEAARIAEAIRKATQRPRGQEGSAPKEFVSDLDSVCREGRRAVNQLTKTLPLDDSFAAVEEPALTLLDRFPATPAGHVAFLEFVRDELGNAAEAKRNQFAREYSNATIESMVRGRDMRMAEARRRIATLSGLPTGVVQEVDRVLRRELTPGTVERIDELLPAAVAALRDAWEDRGQPQPEEPTSSKKAKRSTQKGDGRLKLIAALTKHHQYADGGCLNLEPIGNNELARLAGVDQATASAFFTKQFNGHGKYKAACARATGLALLLKSLNGELRPRDFYASEPAYVERDED